MRTEGPLDAPVTSGSVVGGATWGLRNGFDVAPRGARAPSESTEYQYLLRQLAASWLISAAQARVR